MEKSTGTQFTLKEVEILKYLRRFLFQNGRTPTIRELQILMSYKSPRSITEILERLQNKGIIKRNADKSLAIVKDLDSHAHNASTVNVPLVGSVACGTPLLAEENVEAVLPVSTQLARPPHKYFLLRAIGDSMNEAGIDDGDIVLIKQTDHARAGETVVALIDSEATIKKIKINENAIFLEPRSKNPIHKPIILQSDFKIQGVVVRSLGPYK